MMAGSPVSESTSPEPQRAGPRGWMCVRWAEHYGRALWQKIVAGNLPWWQWPLLIGFCGGIGLCLGLALLRWGPVEFTASMVVGPLGREALAITGQTAALERPPGFTWMESEAREENPSAFTRYIQFLISEVSARQLLASPELVAKLLSEDWDPHQQSWKQPDGIRRWFWKGLHVLTGRQTWQEPDTRIIGAYLQRHLSIDRVNGSAIRRITFRHPERAVALAVLWQIHTAAENHLRHEAGKQSAHYLELLNQKRSQTNNMQQGNLLLDLIFSMERIQMMVNADMPFAADLLEPPAAPHIPDWLPPLRVFLVSFIVFTVVPALLLSARLAFRLKYQQTLAGKQEVLR